MFKKILATVLVIVSVMSTSVFADDRGDSNKYFGEKIFDTYTIRETDISYFNDISGHWASRLLFCA